MALIYFLIAISLSMDAFSLALSLGVTNPGKKEVYLQSILVGIFHFIMPILGKLIGLLTINNLIKDTNIIVSIVFFLLAIEMYRSKNNETNVIIKSIFTIILIAFTVSIDSLIIGIVLSIDHNIVLAGVIFSLVSTVFTYLGFRLGIKFRKRFQDKAIIIGVIIMLILSVYNLFN